MDNAKLFSILAERQAAFLARLKSGRLAQGDAPSLRGSVRVLSKDSPLLALAANPTLAEDATSVDESAMSATFTITTPRRDRYGDVVVPRGCTPHLENYRRNPRVFFAHKSSDLSIGSARHPDGSLAIDLFDDRIRSTVYFHGETAESECVFRLVKRKELETSSIGFIPVVAALIHDDDDEEVKELPSGVSIPDGEEAIRMGSWLPLRFLEWDLTEWSIVPVPANPDACEALTLHLEKGHVEGERMPLSLKKALEPYKLRAKVWSHGFNPETNAYSGVLALGESELEYEEGKLVRIDDISLRKAPPAPIDESNPAEGATPPAASIIGINFSANKEAPPVDLETLKSLIRSTVEESFKTLFAEALQTTVKELSTLDDTAGGVLVESQEHEKKEEAKMQEILDCCKANCDCLTRVLEVVGQHAAKSDSEHKEILAAIGDKKKEVKEEVDTKQAEFEQALSVVLSEQKKVQGELVRRLESLTGRRIGS